MNSDDGTLKRVGCPIRRFPDHSLLAAPQDFSQPVTSFFASRCQGIHQMPFRRLIQLSNHTQGTEGRSLPGKLPAHGRLPCHPCLPRSPQNGARSKHPTRAKSGGRHDHDQCQKSCSNVARLSAPARARSRLAPDRGARHRCQQQKTPPQTPSDSPRRMSVPVASGPRTDVPRLSLIHI